MSLDVELPTGDKDRQLGSALVDYQLNGILQKSLTERTKFRLNSGVLFSGNTLSGAIGIETRGTQFTGGASLVRQFTDKLGLGAEVTGAVTKGSQFGKGQLQFQTGGNYQLKEGFTFDFGMIGGHFQASPRVGLQRGFSVDF